ncbi:hypothetical protein PTSG_07840 [Salpingoeca rosetta]|uniref:Uncharacterized protein n=1 Tax=Salpingoeca rosetta (strain ATCC 50818 / BSB-021) TaxID=946362 RepID=F2UGH4_SALR5|nr:uncharacterized protein PTSG_07840 [Salpingoeca rosetta]EGD75724.1 hypothetical protein PTSG_07840 [Salpingoeca rosetta]|eukprot:XP_004991645.1 hypothetical protein PTSG_07840 [Salpingoeca rosetta]
MMSSSSSLDELVVDRADLSAAVDRAKHARQLQEDVGTRPLREGMLAAVLAPDVCDLVQQLEQAMGEKRLEQRQAAIREARTALLELAWPAPAQPPRDDDSEGTEPRESVSTASTATPSLPSSITSLPIEACVAACRVKIEYHFGVGDNAASLKQQPELMLDFVTRLLETAMRDLHTWRRRLRSSWEGSIQTLVSGVNAAVAPYMCDHLAEVEFDVLKHADAVNAVIAYDDDIRDLTNGTISHTDSLFGAILERLPPLARLLAARAQAAITNIIHAAYDRSNDDGDDDDDDDDDEIANEDDDNVEDRSEDEHATTDASVLSRIEAKIQERTDARMCMWTRAALHTCLSDAHFMEPVVAHLLVLALREWTPVLSAVAPRAPDAVSAACDDIEEALTAFSSDCTALITDELWNLSTAHQCMRLAAMLNMACYCEHAIQALMREHTPAHKVHHAQSQQQQKSRKPQQRDHHHKPSHQRQAVDPSHTHARHADPCARVYAHVQSCMHDITTAALNVMSDCITATARRALLALPSTFKHLTIAADAQHTHQGAARSHTYAATDSSNDGDDDSDDGGDSASDGESQSHAMQGVHQLAHKCRQSVLTSLQLFVPHTGAVPLTLACLQARAKLYSAIDDACASIDTCTPDIAGAVNVLLAAVDDCTTIDAHGTTALASALAIQHGAGALLQDGTPFDALLLVLSHSSFLTSMVKKFHHDADVIREGNRLIALTAADIDKLQQLFADGKMGRLATALTAIGITALSPRHAGDYLLRRSDAA